MDGAVEIQSLFDGVDWLRLDLLAKLLLAALLGGLVGAERELSGKPAGLRTNMLICLGATLLGDVSIHFAALGPAAQVASDPARIAAQIVSGIGFLGAGTIIQARGSVTGLTTAATLWVVAAIGIAVGGGAWVAAIGTTFLVLVALVPLGWVERFLARRRMRRTLRIEVARSPGVFEEIERTLERLGLDAECESLEREPDAERLVLEFTGRGPADAFGAARSELGAREDVLKIVLGPPE